VADDIVTRLAAHNHVGQCAGCLHCEAAVEILRLREQNATLQDAVSEEGRANRMTTLYEKSFAEVEWLRAEVVRLREHINGLAASHPLARPYEPPTWLTARDSWEVDRGNT
jgi:hypothetical protein